MDILKEILKKKMEKQIDLVLDGLFNEVKLTGVYPDGVIDYLKTKFNNVDWEMDTNGWQWDFWITITCDEVTYELKGSGFYGNIIFGLNEEVL